MGDRDDDSSLRFLLAGGRLSGADHDRILARVRRAAAPPRRFGWWLAGFGATLSAAAAALVIGVGLRHGTPDAGAPGALTAKGQAASAAGLGARCPGRPRGSCHIGDRLIFEVEGASRGGLLAAYAENASGEKIWYFPTREGHLAEVPASAGVSVVGEAARIGPEHAPGRYTLHLFVLDRPVDRAALSSGKAGARAAGAFSLEVGP
jgi:hypothetical protein